MTERDMDSFSDERDDHLIALSRMENEMPAIPLEEVIERLGLPFDSE
jgi:hypothetical protein